MITKDTTIEELVEKVPGAIKYLMEHGIRCIICGEPIWGTLEEAAKEKGHNDEAIEKFVKDLNTLLTNPQSDQQTQVQTRIDVQKIDLNPKND